MAKKKLLDEVKFSIGHGASLFGITNYMKDYQIAYYLNKVLDIELERENDFEFWRKKQNEPEYFSFYTCTDAFKQLMYMFLSVKSCSDETLLHKNLKGLEYLFFIFGRDHSELADFFNEHYREIPNTILIKHFNFSGLNTSEEENEASALFTVGSLLSDNEEIPRLKDKDSKTQKGKKTLGILFDFLEAELLPEIEMNMMSIAAENHKPFNI